MMKFTVDSLDCSELQTWILVENPLCIVSNSRPSFLHDRYWWQERQKGPEFINADCKAIAYKTGGEYLMSNFNKAVQIWQSLAKGESQNLAKFDESTILAHVHASGSIFL